VIVLLDVNFTVKGTGITVQNMDAAHLWHFDDEGMLVKFGERFDTHQQWLAYGGSKTSNTEG
jgi:hypothetical protein